MGALLELRSQMRKLQWYGEVNRRGFIKITKKLDKKVPRVSTQQRYLSSKVDPRPFAHNLPLAQDMKAVNEWLSILSEAKTFDDSTSSHSATSLSRAPARLLNLSTAILDTVEKAIRGDDVHSLSDALGEVFKNHDSSSAASQQLHLNFLQRSISCKSKTCIDRLLPDIESLDEEDDINKRNCIHRLVISIGRSRSGDVLGIDGASRQNITEASHFIVPAELTNWQPQPSTLTKFETESVLGEDDDSAQFLTYLLGKLQPQQRSALQSRDVYGRLPLHYATQYGFVVICQIVIKHMQDWGQFDVTEGIDSPHWQDAEGYAPLHLAVIGSHSLITKILLQAANWQENGIEKYSSRRISRSGAVLLLATQSNLPSIVTLLVEAGVDVNYQDEQGETALHVAAQFGHEECAKALLKGSVHFKTDVDVAEKTFGWTPLFIACVDGHLPVVELLVAAGADMERCDLSGWTAKEHAALRGHINIVQCLIELAPPSRLPIVDTLAVPTKPTAQAPSLEERGSKSSYREKAVSQKPPEPVKTFGHRYLTKETMVLVSLGSMDMRKNVPAVKLDAIPLANAHATQLDTALSVVVSASGATGEPTVIDLPVQDNISTEPITFMSTNAANVKILFDIVPTYAGSHKRIVGRAVALLSSVKPSIGSQRITLQGDLQVPIVAATTLDVIGCVNFNFLIITPFSHPNMAISEQHTYWKKMTPQMVIGHRGLGKNTNSRTSLQLGENTLQSFIAAANLGATYVEFDVQLTKDHVPVIYHDFLVSETGIDAPVHTLTLEQFLHISETQTPRESRPESPVENLSANGTNGRQRSQRRLRASSVDDSAKKKIQANYSLELSERMKHTRDFKIKGYKANSRGTFIQSPFTTLEEMFKKLPESTGFNIEMSMYTTFSNQSNQLIIP
jgi:glycerophosphodiester phosphodiesterase